MVEKNSGTFLVCCFFTSVQLLLKRDVISTKISNAEALSGTEIVKPASVAICDCDGIDCVLKLNQNF